MKILFVPDVRLFQDDQKEEITPKKVPTHYDQSTQLNLEAGRLQQQKIALCATEDTIRMISIIFGQDHKNVAWSDESAAFEW